jgi:hypothetical protein
MCCANLTEYGFARSTGRKVILATESKTPALAKSGGVNVSLHDRLMIVKEAKAIVNCRGVLVRLSTPIKALFRLLHELAINKQC